MEMVHRWRMNVHQWLWCVPLPVCRLDGTGGQSREPVLVFTEREQQRRTVMRGCRGGRRRRRIRRRTDVAARKPITAPPQPQPQQLEDAGNSSSSSSTSVHKHTVSQPAAHSPACLPGPFQADLIDVHDSQCLCHPAAQPVSPALSLQQ